MGLTGCGGRGSSAQDGPVNALASIPDTAAYRSFVALNDLQAVWHSAGLPFPPAASQVASSVGTAAFRQLAGGSQVGSLLWGFAPGTDVLGYDPFALSAEAEVGLPPNDLSVVQGPIDPSRLRAALGAAGVTSTSSGGVVSYTVADPAQLTALTRAALLEVHTLTVLLPGGRLATGGSGVPPGDILNLLRDHHSSPSLASDPLVKQVLGVLKGADVMLFGTSLVVGEAEVLGAGISPHAVAQFRDRLGMDGLPAAPTFAGYGYLPDSPTEPTVVAVAVYPTAEDARAASSIIGNVLRFGVSPHRNQPYSQVLAVDKITIDGDALVARLGIRQAGVMAQLVAADDFPLFWSPLPKSS
jgi:hypothetical protein